MRLMRFAIDFWMVNKAGWNDETLSRFAICRLWLMPN